MGVDTGRKKNAYTQQTNKQKYAFRSRKQKYCSNISMTKYSCIYLMQMKYQQLHIRTHSWFLTLPSRSHFISRSSIKNQQK